MRTALRMRPDRIVLGECRGPEVRDVLTALNTQIFHARLPKVIRDGPSRRRDGRQPSVSPRGWHVL